MKRPGQIVLFRFPQTDLGTGKLRPALLLGRFPLDAWPLWKGKFYLARSVKLRQSG